MVVSDFVDIKINKIMDKYKNRTEAKQLLFCFCLSEVTGYLEALRDFKLHSPATIDKMEIEYRDKILKEMGL